MAIRKISILIKALYISLLASTLIACSKSDSNTSSVPQPTPTTAAPQQAATPAQSAASPNAIEGILGFLEKENVSLYHIDGNTILIIKDDRIKNDFKEQALVGKKVKLDGKPVSCKEIGKEIGLPDESPAECFEVSTIVKDLKETAKQKVIELLAERVNRGLDLSEFRKQPDFEAKIMEYYNDVTSANSKLPQDLGENDIKAKVASLNDKQSKLYRDAASNISVTIQEKSSKTLIGGQYKTAVVLRNRKDTGFFSSNYEIKKVDVILKLKDPIFGIPVHFEKLTFSGIEPGETKTIEITSRFGGLEILEKSFYLRKVDKKGVTYDSNIFNI